MLQNTLFPIFLIIIIGTVLRKKDIYSEDFIINATRLMDYILLPIFFFWIIASGKNFEYFNWRVYLAAIFSILIVYLIAHMFIRFVKPSHTLSFAFATSCYRFNLYLGISLIFYLFEKNISREFCIFLLFLIPFTDLFTWIGSVPILKKLGMNDIYFRQIIRRIFLNPLLIAGILGLLLSSLNISLPGLLNKTFEMISSIIFPLALIMTGGALIQSRTKIISKLSVVGAGLKTILMPILVFIFLQLFKTDSEVLYTVVPFFALPFMLDRQVIINEHILKQDNTSQFTTISAIFSFFSISFCLYFLGQ